MEELIRRIQELSAGNLPSDMYGPPRFEPNPDPDAVAARFTRPDAREFYTRFDPQNAVIDSLWGDMTLYPFATLEKEQAGFAFDAFTREPVADWPKGMMVIGECALDPIMLHPAVSGEVLFALHGQGEWKPLPIAANLLGFLKACVAWLDMVRQRGDDLKDDTLALRPESWALFVKLARTAGIDQTYINNMAELS